MELVEFLRARLDEREQKARAATPGPWRHDPSKHWRKPGSSWFEEAVFAGPRGADAICVAGTGETGDPQSMADADHIADNDPAWVLADVEAKRRILDRWQELTREVLDAKDRNDLDAAPTATEYAYEQVARTVALPYAGHPDYDPAWRP